MQFRNIMFEEEQEIMEKIINRVRETLSPEATIIRNDRVTSSKDEKITYDVYLSVRYQIFNYPILIIVEKNEKTEKVTKFLIEKFYLKVKDVQANRGVFISDNGFTEDAVQWAKQYSMDLCSINEAKTKDWSDGLIIPTIFDFRKPDLLVHFLGDVPEGFDFSGEELMVEIPLEEGGEIRLHKLFQLMWNDAWIPHEVGNYEYTVPVYQPVVVLKNNNMCTIKNIVFKIEVNSRKYFGYLDLSACRGINERIQGENTSGQLDAGLPIDISLIMKEWEDITDINSPINFPTMILEFREKVL